MSNKSLTLSIIIPAYNEERHLGVCLDSIARQSLKPDEVIVVDNNSTDKTAEIARSYPFVTLLHEPEQGLIAARNCGLHAAKGDLLARIDADAILDSDWVKVVKARFQDRKTDTITGPARTCMEPHFPRWQSTFWSRVYFRYALATFRINVLWGPNMVMRRQVWDRIHDEASTKDRAVHEDQDLSVLTRLNGFSIINVPELLISTDGGRFASLGKLLEYNKRRKATLLLHRYNLKRIDHDISSLDARLTELVLMPMALIFGISSAICSIEALLGLRKH